MFLVFQSPAYAVFTISGAPSSITDNEEFEISVSLNVSGSSGNNYYLRGALSHIDSVSSYFGFTKNNANNWHSGSSEHTQYFQVTMNSSGAWSGTISFKPDLESSSYKGSGTYNLKVGRYTQAGSGPTWADNTLSINLTSSSTPTPSLIPTPSPNPPTPIPSPSPTPTPTPSPTPTPTPSPTSTPTIRPKSPSPIPTEIPKEIVLGLKDSMSSSPTPIPFQAPKEEKSPLAIVMIILGIGFLGVAGFSFIKSRDLKEESTFDTIKRDEDF